MDNLSGAKADYRAFANATRPAHLDHLVPVHRDLRVLHRLLGRVPHLAQDAVPRGPVTLAFLGALVGALTRPLGGIVSDRLGGARITIASFGLLTLGALGAIVASAAQLPAVLRLVHGAVHRRRNRQRRDLPDDPGRLRAGITDPDRLSVARKAAAGCIGIAEAVGAYGGFFIPRGFAMAKELRGSLVPALWVFVAAYLLMALTTYVVYQRKGSALAAETI